MKRNKGITLIALIVTIIVLLILAGITLNMVMGDSGIFKKANMAKEQTNLADATESLKIMLLEIKTQVTTEEKRETKVKDCSKLDGKEDVTKIEYISEGIAKTEIVGEEIENPKYALVTYRNYEFKIDEQLKIVGQSGANNIEEDEEIKTGLISETEYKINNETLSFSHIAVVGENEELKTIKEGFDYLYDNGYKEDGAILLRKGSYDTADLHIGSSYNINSKYNEMSISIIADEPGNTFMTTGEIGMSANNSKYWIKLKFYRIIFTLPVYSDIGSDGFTLNQDTKVNEYYNCVFLPPVGGYNGIVSTTEVNTYNCLFVGGANSLYTTYPTSGKSENCASTTTTIEPCNGTKTTCLTNIAVDLNYSITSEGWKNTGTGLNPDGSTANIGVYGGKYAWDMIYIENVDLDSGILTIDVSSSYQSVKGIKYIKGKVDEESVLKEGTEVKLSNKVASVSGLDGGDYTFVIELASGNTIIKNVHVNATTKKCNLGVSTTPGLEIYKGTPDFQGEDNGVYLENAILKLNCPLESSYTLIIETKDIETDTEPNNYAGAIVGYGYGASGVGSCFLGISKWYQTYFGAMTGSGDGYTIAKPIDTYPKGKWTTLAIKYDGKEFALYVDGDKIGTSGSSTRIGDTLYIGGFSNIGTSSGVYWGYAKGYYRNLAVYDIALTDEQIANYQF